MLKVNSTSSNQGGTGTSIIAKMSKTNSGMMAWGVSQRSNLGLMGKNGALGRMRQKYLLEIITLKLIILTKLIWSGVGAKQVCGIGR
jgi:hypothetical protein